MSPGRTERFWLEPFEDRGHFLHARFDEETDETVIFIAEQDLKNVSEMIEDGADSMEKFRREIFELIEHTGHDEEHELTESSLRELCATIRDYSIDTVEGADDDGSG